MVDDADSSPLSLIKLQQNVESGHVDTVLVCFTDMQGRLQGKRMHGRYFLNEVKDHGTEACNYLLAVDVDMDTVDGYDLTSWDTGYGDFLLKPDLSTLRAAPWLPSTAMVQCDVFRLQDHEPVAQSPRQLLKAMVARAAERGYTALAGTELEFMVFDTSYEDAWDGGYRNLVPSNRYNVDYSILGGGRVEPLLRDIRNAMTTAGLVVESAKGECNLGQHEIAFKYDDVLRTADQHVVYKTAAKELAARHGKSLTFMAKFDQREGNSCHIHMSLRGEGDAPDFAEEDLTDPERYQVSGLFRSFLAGMLATLPDFTLFYAPNINSYKRFQPGSFAPTSVAWGVDNRTCALRVVGADADLRVIGSPRSLRIENRLPGGDVNPYLALSAMLAGGLWGVERGLVPSQGALIGNAYRYRRATIPTRMRELVERGIRTVPASWTAGDLDAHLLSVPTSLEQARDLFAASPVADAMFGPEVVKHYVNMADVELAAYARSVTDWERYRGFERL